MTSQEMIRAVYVAAMESNAERTKVGAGWAVGKGMVCVETNAEAPGVAPRHAEVALLGQMHSFVCEPWRGVFVAPWGCCWVCAKALLLAGVREVLTQ